MPSIRVNDGSRYNVTKEPKRNIIMKIKKNTPTFLNKDSSKTFFPILNLIIARG